MEDVQDFLKQFTWPLLEKILEAEMDIHLGYKKHDIIWYNTWNSRNGNSKKKIRTTSGDIDLDIPRDRKWEFQPQIIGKYQSNMNSIEEKIVWMYALWLSTQDISDHVKEIYWTWISADMISAITDKIMPQIIDYQTRWLEKCYPIVFLDAIHCKVRQNGTYSMKAVYMVVGYDVKWHKDMLWFYIGESESSKFWLKVCSDLKTRWVESICIACVDGLVWFPEAIRAVFWNQIEIQRCIVHQIRNSLRFASFKHSKDLKKDLASIYKAPNIETAEKALTEFEAKRSAIYPTVTNSRRNHWVELSTYFNYPDVIRKLIYTTNIIESNNSRIRKVIPKWRTFPTEQSLEKLMYLVIQNIQKKRTMPVHNWWQIINQLCVAFPHINQYTSLPQS